jgi:hypothetical protein
MFDHCNDPIRVMARIFVALVATVAVAEDDVVRREIVFDGEIQSTLPPISIDHGVPIWDSERGIEVPVGDGLFDRSRNGLNAGPWRIPDDVGLLTAGMVLSGRSRDGTQPRIAIFDRARLELFIWNSADTSRSSDRRIVMRREGKDGEINDTFAGTSFERADHSYRIVSGTMLPGCMLFLLQRSVLEKLDDGSGASEWVIRGVTIAAFQETADGDWEWTDRQDMPDPDDPEAPLFNRGYMSSMSSYYPTERSADFKEVFVPLVDYMNHSDQQATGGQCGIFRARRAHVGAAWTIDPLVEIHSSWQNEGEHFHVAGWTPNGVVLAIGDGTKSRVALLKCADWASYADLSNWTVIPRWQGVLDDGVTQVTCNQFWSCCPSNDPNRLLCGGDNVAGAILGLDVPAESDSPPVFEGLIGVQPAVLTDGLSGNTVSWLQRTTPETEGPIVARQILDPWGHDKYTRVLLSLDGDSFATVARLPEDMEKAGVPFLVEGGLRVHRFNNIGVQGIFAASIPSEDQVQAGLLVRPGCVDLLRDDLGRHRPPMLITPAGGITVTRLERDELPFGLGAELAPDSVVYRVSGTPSRNSSNKLLSSILEDPREFKPGRGAFSTAVHMRVCNLQSSKLRLWNRVDRGGLTSDRTHSVVATREWSYFDIWTATTDTPATCSVTIWNPAGDGYSTVDFLLMFRSLTEGGGMPGWPRGPTAGGVVPPTRVSQPLAIRGDAWKVHVQMQIPPEGIDYSLGSRVHFMPLCAFEFGPGRFVRARWRVTSGSIFIDSLVGDQQWDLGEIHGIRLNRGDTIDVKLQRREGSMTFTVVAAGSAGSEPAEIPLSIVHAVPPTRFLLGDENHELVSALVLRRIAVETPTRPWPTRISPVGELSDGANREGMTHDGPRDKGERVQTRFTTERSTHDLAFDVLARLGEPSRHRFDPHDADGDGTITFLDLRQLLLGVERNQPRRSPGC